MVRLMKAWHKDMPNRRDLLLLLSIGGLYALATFLSNTFVNIYLWKQSNDFVSIALYNLSICVLQPVAFFVAGKWAKRIDRTFVLRIGVVFMSIFYVTVLIAGEHASQYAMLLGALLGIGAGFYWLSFNVLTFEITEPESRDFFNGTLGTLQSLGGMIGPFFAGYIITRLDNFQGYSLIFVLSFILFAVAMVCSFFLAKRKVKGTFSFKQVLQEQKQNKDWHLMLGAHVFQGLREGFFVFVIAIWVFLATDSELALGSFNLILSLCSLIGYYWITNKSQPKHRKKLTFFGGLILAVSVTLLVIQTNYWTLLIYGMLVGFAYPMFNIPFVSLTYDIIGKARGAKNLRIEYIIVREVYMNIGRISSIVLFIIAVSWKDPMKIIPILMCIIGLGNLVASFFVKRTHLDTSSHAIWNKQ
ncbi:MFS transporter [Gracilibacillus alcaliphilus]|uniref:MFS transporter n=1 Tax=Gracilibacillus alcaliphilus TaxID=1401441 RepID=UPI0019569EB0|nr:MFS transporter [Gracilibacillus alcaliphilus]MBM7675013.1 YQGE family putative transporter [Gracilibacillus alcaliphilus]